MGMILTLCSIAASAMPTNRVIARVGLSSYIPACIVDGAPQIARQGVPVRFWLRIAPPIEDGPK